MKTKIFNTILDVVSEVCEVSTQDILSLKKDIEIAEARVLLVWFCYQNGMYSSDIAKFINRKNQNSVTERIHEYHERIATSTMFRCYVTKIARILPARISSIEEEEINNPPIV